MGSLLPPTSPPQDIFVGHQTLLIERANRLRAGGGRIGVIHGPSGVGKTAFAHHLVGALNDDTDIEAIYYELELPTGPAEPFMFLHGKIYDEVKPRGFAALRNGLNDNPASKLCKLGWAGVKDLVAKFGGDAKNTTDALAQVVSDSVVLVPPNQLRDQIGESNFSKLVDALNSAAISSSKKYVLVLDGVERASESCIGLLSGMLKRLPKNICIQLVINSEEAAWRRDDFVRFKAHLQYHHLDDICELPSLNANEIKEWVYRASGHDIPLELAEGARDASDGRPILLKPWVDTGSGDLEKIVAQSGRLNGFYDELYNACDDNEKSIARLLAVVFPYPLMPDWLVSATNCDSHQVSGAIEKLRDKGFVEEFVYGYRCKHYLIARFLIDIMGEVTLRSCKNHLFNVFVKVPTGVVDVSRLTALTADTVTIDAGNEGLEALLTYIRSLVKHGASADALMRITVLDDLINSWGNIPDQKQVEVELLRAEVFEQQGRYENVIETVTSACQLDINQEQINKLHFLMGVSYFRLNQYGNAVKVLKRVRKDSDENQQVVIWSKSIVRIFGVLMDINKWDMALQCSHILLEKVLPKLQNSSDGNILAECHVLRTAARVYAPYDSEKATDLVTQALNIAHEIESDRVFGNCYFALGEVLRHAGKLDVAMSSYKKALKIGRDTGCKDLAVYSLLGMTVIELVTKNRTSFNALVGDLDEAIDYRAPVESANLSLFKHICSIGRGESFNAENMDHLKDDFVEFRRSWQIEIISSIRQSTNISFEQLAEQAGRLRIVF